LETTGYTRRKTGLIIPYWLADRHSDRLKSVEQERICFYIPKIFLTPTPMECRKGWMAGTAQRLPFSENDLFCGFEIEGDRLFDIFFRFFDCSTLRYTARKRDRGRGNDIPAVITTRQSI
jgi:hypothetical protein